MLVIAQVATDRPVQIQTALLLSFFILETVLRSLHIINLNLLLSPRKGNKVSVFESDVIQGMCEKAFLIQLIFYYVNIHKIHNL